MKHKKDAIENATKLIEKLRSDGHHKQNCRGIAISAVKLMLEVGIYPMAESLWRRTLNYLEADVAIQRIYSSSIPDYARIMTAQEFKESENKGFLMDDGHGYWCKDGKKSDDDVFNTEQQDATHVAWYNK